MHDEAPFSQTFFGMSEYQVALDTVIDHARHTLQLFDFDLSDGDWNSPQRYERLTRFLRGGVQNRLQIVLHSVEYVGRHCPRMLNLLREHSYAMSIHQTNAEARAAFDPMLIGDDAHYVHRFHFDQPRGEYVLNDLVKTRKMIQRFDEIWQASTLAVSATTLGL